MTVKELLDVIAPQKEIFIKPAGRRMYFDGITDEIPADLLNAVVVEIVPQVYRDDDPFAAKRYYGAWGVWVNPIPEWDEKADRITEAAQQKVKDQPRERFDFLSDLTPIPDELLVLDGEGDRR